MGNSRFHAPSTHPKGWGTGFFFHFLNGPGDAGDGNRGEGEIVIAVTNQKIQSMNLLSGICGQDIPTRTLSHLVESNRLPGTILFSGPGGTGKLATALKLAKSLNCSEGSADGCDCVSCRAIRTGTHPDVIVLSRDRQILVDDMREIVALGSLRASPGRERLIILDRAENITEPAANAALKMLEESGEHVRFILITDIPSKLLPTVLSRSYQLRFSLLSRDEMIGFAEAIGDNPSDEISREAIRFAGGRPGLYLRWVHSDGYREVVGEINTWLNGLVERGGERTLSSALKWKEELHGKGSGKDRIPGFAERLASIERKSNLPRGGDTYEIKRHLASSKEFVVKPVNWRIDEKRDSQGKRWGQGKEILLLAGLMRRILSLDLSVRNARAIHHLHDFMEKIRFNCSFDIALERLYFQLAGI